jgi:hypothetical protein
VGLKEFSGPGYVVDVTDITMKDVTVVYNALTGWSCLDPLLEFNCTRVNSGVVFDDILNSNK